MTGTFKENGFTMEGWSYTNDGAIHLDDSPSEPWKDSVVISRGHRFDAQRLDIVGLGSLLYYEVLDPETSITIDLIDQVAYPNVLVQGIRDGSLVAETRFYADEFPSYTLSSAFEQLDSLIVSAIDPFAPAVASYLLAFEANLASLYPGMTYRKDCFDYPCGHFDLDAVEVNPTPIPGALVLMLSAILGGGIARRFMNKERVA